MSPLCKQTLADTLLVCNDEVLPLILTASQGCKWIKLVDSSKVTAVKRRLCLNQCSKPIARLRCTRRTLFAAN